MHPNIRVLIPIISSYQKKNLRVIAEAPRERASTLMKSSFTPLSNTEEWTKTLVNVLLFNFKDVLACVWVESERTFKNGYQPKIASSSKLQY